MTDNESFIRAICIDPHDVPVRLIYADWLEEHGEADRSKFIRVQIELARWPMHIDWLRQMPVEKWVGSDEERIVLRELEALRRRERELWGYLPKRDGIMTRISSSLPAVAVLLDSDNGFGLTHEYPWAFVRHGFIEKITCRVEDWLTYGPAIVQRQPVVEVLFLDRLYVARDNLPFAMVYREELISPCFPPNRQIDQINQTAAIAWARQQAGLPEMTQH